MIAAGLCLMGGCFAQDSSAQAVDTYWPAHSLHMQQGDAYAFSGLAGLILPFWEENMRAGSIAENIAWTVSIPGHLGGFGKWVSGICDAAYFGPGVAAFADYGYSPGAQCLGIFTVSPDERVYNVIENASPIALMQVEFKGSEFTVSTQNASQTKSIPRYPDDASASWGISFRSPNFEYDMVIQWWRNDVVQQRFFMVQPLKTPAGDSAFFIHGYDILTEI